jgi:hypothetical protein
MDMDGVLADTERDPHIVEPLIKCFNKENIDTEWTEENEGEVLEVGGGKERMTAYWKEGRWPSVMQDMTEKMKNKTK